MAGPSAKRHQALPGRRNPYFGLMPSVSPWLLRAAATKTPGEGLPIIERDAGQCRASLRGLQLFELGYFAASWPAMRPKWSAEPIAMPQQGYSVPNRPVNATSPAAYKPFTAVPSGRSTRELRSVTRPP